MIKLNLKPNTVQVKLTWDRAIWLHALGRLPPSSVPEAATQALVDGLDSRELRVLAGLTPAEAESRAVSLNFALAPLRIEVPDPVAAAGRLLVSVSEDIVEHRVEALDGARSLAEIVWRTGLSLPAFDPFNYAADEYEERPREYRLFRKMVMTAATDIVDASRRASS